MRFEANVKKHAEDERRSEEEIATSGIPNGEIEKETSTARASEERSSDEADKQLREAITGIEGLIASENGK